MGQIKRGSKREPTERHKPHPCRNKRRKDGYPSTGWGTRLNEPMSPATSSVRELSSHREAKKGLRVVDSELSSGAKARVE